MQKIRKGDNVVVLSGRDKGRKGAVVQVLADGRVVVESVNMVKKHTKPNPQAKTPTPGGIVEKEMPMPVSKVAIWNPGAKKADRVGFKTLTDGKKVRFFKSNGEMLDA
jgi:large subunit ribosomal protein L24